jgi:Flp pilus assembly pilin Flp
LFIWRDEQAASLIEWAVLASLIAIVALVAVAFVGGETSLMYSEIGDGFTP